MRAALRTATVLALSGGVVAGLTAPVQAASAGAAQASVADFDLVETWDVAGALEQIPGASLTRLMVQSQVGDLFAVSEVSGPADEETGASGSDGVVRFSPDGQFLGSWDYNVLFPADRLRSTSATGADVDSDGNLVLALTNIFYEEGEEGLLVRTGTSGQLVTFSPTGAVLTTVDLAEGLVPEGLTHVGGISYVVSRLDSSATRVVGYDRSGTLVSEFDLDDVRPVGPYGSFAHTPDGRLVMLADATDDFGADTSVVVFSRDGQVLDRWVARMPTEWTQEQIEATPTGYINDDPQARGIAVGPSGDVVLTNEGIAVEVRGIDGAHRQSTVLPFSASAYMLKARTLGPDGRLYVSNLHSEVFVYERATPIDVEPIAWTATACVAFAESVNGPQDEPDVTFEVTEGTLPDGITLDAATGIVSGTSTAVGEHSVTISALVAGVVGASQPIVLTIQPGVATSVTVPVITGDAVVGATLTATAQAQPASDLAYQWLRDDTAIPGAVDQSYTVTTQDAGTQITVQASTITGCPATSQGPTLTVPDAQQPTAEHAPDAPDAGDAATHAPLATTGFAGLALLLGAALLALGGIGLLLARHARQRASTPTL